MSHTHRTSAGNTALPTGAYPVHTHLTAWGPSSTPLQIGAVHFHLTGGGPSALNANTSIALSQLLPPGPPFAAPYGSTLAAILDALGNVFDLWLLSADELLTEWDPRATSNLLVDWEAAYGLPGSNPSPPSTLHARQQALWAKTQGYQSPTKAYMVQLAAALGYTATVTDPWVAYPLFACTSACTSACNAEFWAFVWTLNATSQGPTQDALLKWTIGNVTPLHTVCLFNLT